MFEMGLSPSSIVEGFHVEKPERSCLKWTVRYVVGALKLPLLPPVEKNGRCYGSLRKNRNL
jgi:hypothetical protein